MTVLPFRDSFPLTPFESLESNEVEITEKLWRLCLSQMLRNQEKKIPLRAFHTKRLGAVRGRFQVRKDLDEAFESPVFQPGASYEAIIRFSSAPGAVLPDIIPIPRGFAVKLNRVSGERLLNQGPPERCQDFVCVNSPVFPLKNTRELEEMMEAIAKSPLSVAAFFASHPRAAYLFARHTDWLLRELSSLTYSTVAPLLFAGRPAKLRFVPEKPSGLRLPNPFNPNFLHTRLKEALSGSGRSFRVEVQLQTNPQTQKVEDGTSMWSETQAPFAPVATLRIEKQQMDQGEDSSLPEEVNRASFSPWNGILEHQPLGNLMRARREIYLRGWRHRKRVREQEQRARRRSKSA